MAVRFRSLFVMMARRLRGARRGRAGGGALDAADDQCERDEDDNFSHSSLGYHRHSSAGFRRSPVFKTHARGDRLCSISMNPTRGRMEGAFERTLTVSGSVTLEVSANSGVIRVLKGEAGSVRIRGVLRPRSSLFAGVFMGGTPTERIRRLEACPPIAQDGNAIGVGDVTDRWLLRGINLLLEITAPADTEVRALADSGDIRIEGINGPVECETDSGAIHVAGIGSDVRASSDSGGIYVRGVKGSVDLRADSGAIEALEIEGTIDAKTDSGDIRLSQTIVKPICAQADSGRIRVQLAPEGGYSVRARTDNGRVELPVLTRQRLSRHELEGDVRGGGSVVDLETDSGDIEVVAG
jgi:hypothetical protein